MLRDCAIDRPSDVFLFILFQVLIVYARDERSVYENMEESSERVVRLEQHDEITMGDDLIIHSIPQDLALAVSAIYDRMMVDVEELLFNQIRDTFLSYTTPSYLGFVGLPDEECQLPRPALCKARRRRDPPPRVSRRSSQVSPPIYLRHRFLPQSRKDSSSRRQR
ncbi:unnamed protein product [Brassica oleracea]